MNTQLIKQNYFTMKKSLLSFFTVTLLCLMTGKPVMAQELPTQKETLETIVKVNDYFMKKYADYTLPSFYGRVRPSNICADREGFCKEYRSARRAGSCPTVHQ